MKNDTYSISAKDIEIWAKKGVHPVEALLENCFKININITALKMYENNHYLNYETIVDIVVFVFKQPHEILENNCIQIIEALEKAMAGKVKLIECEINKINPAINGMRIGSLGVKIAKEF